MELIDKSAVVAEIEKLIDEIYAGRPFDSLSSEKQTALWYVKSIMSSIHNLETKEVDLEKEIDNIWNPRFNLGWDEKSLLSINHEGFTIIAKHFFEVGLKAKDWREERMKECPYRQVGCTMYSGTILECRGACSWVVDYPKLKELEEKKGE